MAGDGIIECPKCLLAVNALRSCFTQNAELFDVVPQADFRRELEQDLRNREIEDQPILDQIREVWGSRITPGDILFEFLRNIWEDPAPDAFRVSLEDYIRGRFSVCEAFYREAVERDCKRRQPGPRRPPCP